MTDFAINTGIRKIGDKITTPTAKLADEEWFTEDIVVMLSNDNIVATLVVDFAFSATSVIEYTLDSGTTWIPFNENTAVDGGQSRYINVTNDVQVNFRAKSGGNLIRCIVSSVP